LSIPNREKIKTKFQDRKKQTSAEKKKKKKKKKT
jgi:hypothetical protein